MRRPWYETPDPPRSISRRNITSSGFDNQFALRLLSSGIDVELQFTRRPIPLLVRRDKREVVTAAQVIDQRLKSCVELFRFVREYFTAGFVRQIFQVHVFGIDNFVHASSNNLESIFDPLDYDFGNDGANDGARFVNRGGGCSTGRTIRAIEETRHGRNNNYDSPPGWVACLEHVLGGIGKHEVKAMSDFCSLRLLGNVIECFLDQYSVAGEWLNQLSGVGEGHHRDLIDRLQTIDCFTGGAMCCVAPDIDRLRTRRPRSIATTTESGS